MVHFLTLEREAWQMHTAGFQDCCGLGTALLLIPLLPSSIRCSYYSQSVPVLLWHILGFRVCVVCLFTSQGSRSRVAVLEGLQMRSSSSNIYWKCHGSVAKSCHLFVAPWTAACRAFLSFTISQSLLKLMSIEAVMPSNHLIQCQPLLLLPSIFPSIEVFSNELPLCIRWPKYRSFSISPSNECSGLISFRIDWFDLLAVQGTLKSSTPQFKSIDSSVLIFLYSPVLTSTHDYWKNHSFD